MSDLILRELGQCIAAACWATILTVGALQACEWIAEVLRRRRARPVRESRL